MGQDELTAIVSKWVNSEHEGAEEINGMTYHDLFKHTVDSIDYNIEQLKEIYYSIQNDGDISNVASLNFEGNIAEMLWGIISMLYIFDIDPKKALKLYEKSICGKKSNPQVNVKEILSKIISQKEVEIPEQPLRKAPVKACMPIPSFEEFPFTLVQLSSNINSGFHIMHKGVNIGLVELEVDFASGDVNLFKLEIDSPFNEVKSNIVNFMRLLINKLQSIEGCAKLIINEESDTFYDNEMEHWVESFGFVVTGPNYVYEI